jgi:hypothetical protein
VTDEGRAAIEVLERRIAALESAVRELSAGRSAPATHPPPAAPSPYNWVPDELRPANWVPKRLDVESLIGRYGTLVLATVSALAAVGTFLGWAIAQGLLGPAQRIGLGLLLAAGLAVAGMRLRRRERSFAASLLGLALAVIHVCAWGAGPSLNLVPTWAAFLLAAVTSVALAVFAHAENDEPLWCVGFSGAAIAPFVTSSGKGNFFLLTAYGIVVMFSAGYAMNGRRWIVAGRLFLLAAAGYTVALATGFERQYAPLLAMAFPLFVGIGGVIPWTTGGPRRERLRAMGVLAALSALRAGIGMNLPLTTARVAALIAAAGIAWLIIVDRTHHMATSDDEPKMRRLREGDWLDAAVIPLGFILSALMALDASARGSGYAMIAAGGLVLLTVARLPRGSLRDAAVFATIICVVVAELLLLRGRGEALVIAIAALSAACFAGNLVWPSVSWTTLGLIGFAWSLLASLVNLSVRPEYQYTPFLTIESGVAVVILACLVAAHGMARNATVITALRGGVVVWAFVWVHQEIAFAVNETTATLLRVTYYAATSVAAVGVGRALRYALLRHVGLGLAVVAAATALYGARRLDAVAARIAADLVAAVFLLGIAYWYRTPGADAQHRELRTE